jgi:hypothetical protein
VDAGPWLNTLAEGELLRLSASRGAASAETRSGAVDLVSAGAGSDDVHGSFVNDVPQMNLSEPDLKDYIRQRQELVGDFSPVADSAQLREASRPAGRQAWEDAARIHLDSLSRTLTRPRALSEPQLSATDAGAEVKDAIYEAMNSRRQAGAPASEVDGRLRAIEETSYPEATAALSRYAALMRLDTQIRDREM